MKTIEKIIREFISDYPTDAEQMAARSGFRAGVEFAQRWISIEDELPEEDKYVLLKYDFGIYMGGWNGDEFFEETGTIDDSTPTHWRPIEVI